MNVALAGLTMPEPVTLDINIRVSGQILVGSLAARQKVNRFVVSQIGNLLCAGEPELVVDQPLRWRVPVLLTMPGKGELGQTGVISVDAQTGAIDADDLTIARIQRNATYLATSDTSSPKQ
ncbi:MAG: hypothetical protein IAE85_09125 [Anaerolinea sp.]|nr:hypothetical protein [Anaerolinea sp.]HRI56623.1 hypothetical protein [Anaerolineae bacterium]